MSRVCKSTGAPAARCLEAFHRWGAMQAEDRERHQSVHTSLEVQLSIGMSCLDFRLCMSCGGVARSRRTIERKDTFVARASQGRVSVSEHSRRKNFEDCGLPGKLSCHRFVGWRTCSDADSCVCCSESYDGPWVNLRGCGEPCWGQAGATCNSGPTPRCGVSSATEGRGWDAGSVGTAKRARRAALSCCESSSFLTSAAARAD